MTTFRPHLPATAVHASLRRSLEELRVAERNAVLWFAEIWSRKLYRDLGHGSIQQYASVGLGFSRSKTAQFLRLVRALEVLPVLRASLEKGEVSWTKAREVVKVATPKTEAAWVKEARGSSRRQLEKRVAVAQGRAKAARKGDRRQVVLVVDGAKGESNGARAGRVSEEVPVDVHARFSPEQYARYEALMERLRKKGQKGSREELLLAALEVLAESVESSEGAESTRVHSGPVHQVVVQVCEACGKGQVVTSRGSKRLAPATLRAILCDTRVHKPAHRNRATIPPSVRRAVLARDDYRCRGAGCSSARFLSVHHRIPREAGGSNDPDNLVTLCGNCHRAVHRHGRRGETLRRAS